jgi:hypothetical protein
VLRPQFGGDPLEHVPTYTGFLLKASNRNGECDDDQNRRHCERDPHTIFAA